MANEQLIEMAKKLVHHGVNETMELVDGQKAVPATTYTDEALFQQERRQIFHRLPLMLAPSCELPNPGDYKAMEVAGIPVLVTRQSDGSAQAFLNSCTHRGNPIADGSGNAKRFTCNYHGWTFRNDGALMGIANANDFGTVDKASLCLKSFPTEERAGMIFVILNPKSELTVDDFLCGYDEVLQHFGFKDWYLFRSRSIEGPNWKTAYDGYLDLYHLPVLHAKTFGAHMYSRANYFAWGPHQRACHPLKIHKLPDGSRIDMSAMDPSEWPETALLEGVWTIFPHISIATFYGGNTRGAMISQLFPGDDVTQSVTHQYYVMEKEPTDEATLDGANKQFDMLEVVVRDEDYYTGRRQQRALQAGILDHVWFGRNEGGGQAFHEWVGKLIEADDKQLVSLFTKA